MEFSEHRYKLTGKEYTCHTCVSLAVVTHILMSTTLGIPDIAIGYILGCFAIDTGNSTTFLALLHEVQHHCPMHSCSVLVKVF